MTFFEEWCLALWRRHQRQLDVAILWPICKAITEDHPEPLDAARRLFKRHTELDPAWASLTEFEALDQIEELT
jgi:hypothetical protein